MYVFSDMNMAKISNVSKCKLGDLMAHTQSVYILKLGMMYQCQTDEHKVKDIPSMYIDLSTS